MSLCFWTVGSPAASDRPAAGRAAALEETPPSVSKSNLQNKPRRSTSAQRDKNIYFFKKLLFPRRTFVLLWLQVLRLSRTPPVQFSLHDDGHVVVLLLQPDGVHHRGKVHVHQMHPGFFQNLSASAFLPRLSVGAIKITVLFTSGAMSESFSSCGSLDMWTFILKRKIKNKGLSSRIKLYCNVAHVGLKLGLTTFRSINKIHWRGRVAQEDGLLRNLDYVYARLYLV